MCVCAALFHLRGKAAGTAQPFRVKLVRCSAPELVCRYVFDDAALLKYHHTIRKTPQPPEPVLGDEDSFSRRLPLCDDLPQLPDGGNVQIRCRLIQHEDRRPKHTDRGTGNFLLFAAGELGDILPKQLFKPEVLNGLCEAAQYFPLLHADILAGKYDLRVGQKRIKLRLGILEHGADRPGQLMELELGGVISVHHDGARQLSLVIAGDQTG